MLENCAVTVTVVAGSSSATLDGSADRLMAGAPSSSVRVMLVPLTVRPVDVPSTPIVSLPSISVSSVGVRVNVAVPLVSPAVIVMSKALTAA